MAQDGDPNIITLPTQRKHQPCWWCGLDASQERTFTARLTPLSRTPEGRRHTRETLEAELWKQVETWKNTKVVHPKTCAIPAVEQLLAIIDQIDQDNIDAQRLHDIEFALLEEQNQPAIADFLTRHGFKIQDRQPA